MEELEIKQLVGKLLSEGVSLSDIQTVLAGEHEVRMTFLELRMLASELENVDWQKLNKKEEKTEEEKKQETENTQAAGQAPPSDDLQGSLGQTTVEVSKIARPGAVMSGSVNFGSGASAEWVLDQLGRLALSNSNGEPTPEDLKEFQAELQKALSGA